MAGQTLSKVGASLPIISPKSMALSAAEPGCGQGAREVMETSQGRVIAEAEQALVQPSTSKRSKVRPKCPGLFHDSTFQNI